MIVDLARCLVWILVFPCGLAGLIVRGEVPDDFPRFIVPGHEAEMNSLRQLYWLHYQPAGPQIALWDEWLPNATLWPARGTGEDLADMRRRWAQALAGRPIDAEGYVATQQHDGPAHAAGWPFPHWTQAGGVGWHFRPIGVPGYEAPLTTPDSWKLDGAAGHEVHDSGWQVEILQPRATLAPPPFSIEARLAPWLRINWWATHLDHAKCYVEWTTSDLPDFSDERRIYFAAANSDTSAREVRTMIKMFREPQWKGTITKLRLGFENATGGRIVVKSFHTACDTRHNVNNLNYIRGCRDYFMWTGDEDFLRSQILRIRTAMRFVEHEFQTREKKCIYTTWPGHEGRSGVRRIDGNKQIVRGEGIGSNYWDLLPFGGEDALATVYYYDTLLKLADLEELLATHPAWKMPTENAFNPRQLREFATLVKQYFASRFWNFTTGRFGTVDLDGQLHDYGFTFLNCEAVAFDIATPEQTKSIHSWLSGGRTVEGDTSTTDDIYHWRFAARSTTRRNLDYYFWAWSNPESIPWGYQVQDGGAVLGWTHYDLMMRLRAAGPDDVAQRLSTIVRWFNDTQQGGGYRTYYAGDPARGSLQGGNVAGGLGLDREFIESVLATQVMLYGLLGLRPEIDGLTVAPKLPRDWPSLTITRIHWHDQVLDITADQEGTIKLRGIRGNGKPLNVYAPANVRRLSVEGVDARLVTAPER